MNGSFLTSVSPFGLRPRKRKVIALFDTGTTNFLVPAMGIADCIYYILWMEKVCSGSVEEDQ
jgi:hypothetical protein